MATMPRLLLERATKHYGDTRALNGVSFAVEAGAICALIGPNGAGKSTLLRLLVGLVRPSAGAALVDGRRYEQVQEPTRLVGAVLEPLRFHPARTGRDHLRLLARAARLPRGRVDEVLTEVGLAENGSRRVRGYSLGMRQRLALAAALLGRPEILILDEPTTGLDPHGAHWLRSHLRRFAADGGTVLISSHSLNDLDTLATDLALLEQGRLLAAGPLDKLLDNRDGARERLESAFLRLTATGDPA
jgi:ABC-2 type transport system ATP-binding protein